MVSFLRQIRFYWLVLFDRQTPWYVKLILAIGMLYILYPFDLITDRIPVLGWIDDLTIGSLLVGLASILPVCLTTHMALTSGPGSSLLSPPSETVWMVVGFGLTFVIVTAVTSRTIYGLQARVREALQFHFVDQSIDAIDFFENETDVLTLAVGHLAGPLQILNARRDASERVTNFVGDTR